MDRVLVIDDAFEVDGIVYRRPRSYARKVIELIDDHTGNEDCACVGGWYNWSINEPAHTHSHLHPGGGWLRLRTRLEQRSSRPPLAVYTPHETS